MQLVMCTLRGKENVVFNVKGMNQFRRILPSGVHAKLRKIYLRVVACFTQHLK